MNFVDMLVGFLAGAFGAMGVGGGGILLLYLTAFAGVDQLAAQGINLIFFLPAAAGAIFIHIKNGYIKWRSALVSVLFGIPGVFLGSYIAGSIDESLLRTVFALFLLILGGRELFAKGEKNGDAGDGKAGKQ